MRRKIFWKILGVTALALVVFFIAGIAINYASGRNMIRRRLTTETGLVADLLDETEDFSAFQKYYNNDELRVTIIDETGKVLFESDTEAELENHLDREEVKNALQGAPKTVQRYSKTFQCEMTYYALKGSVDGKTVVVRLAVRSSEVSSYFFAALPFFFLSLFLAFIISSFLAGKLSRSVSDKVLQVGESLKSLNAGEYMPLQTDTTEMEFYNVFKEINELNESTHVYMRRQESEQKKLNAVLENVSQSIVALNDKREIVFVNGNALRLFSGKSAVVGRKISRLIDDSGLCEKINGELGEETFAFESEYAGKALSVVGKKMEGEADERALATILIFTDVSKEKEMMRQKSDFFANASHELKTPITVMRGLTEVLLEKESLSETDKKQLSRIHKESLRMADLISDMLKLSKLERGETEMPVTVDLKETAKEVVAELFETMQTKNLRVSVDGEGKVLADPKKIFELIQNLCSNATNYNKQDGSIFVRITEDKENVVLSVEDSGIGIEKEHLPRLCERFYRVDKSRSKKTGGTGLGLAIVKHICALYKAELSIESEIDVGTKVTVKFKK
ncbi:MAG: GHKL domain-containing protein [Clostridia bacterium]|nr:GHKL domain-containing protein [Clostridia bacterium]